VAYASLTKASLVADGSLITGLTAGNLSGTIPSGVLGNSTLYVGTTAVALNRASASLALTGITSIDGTANVSNYQAVTNTTTGTVYPALYSATSGSLAVSANNALSFNAATGALTATSFSGSGSSLTSLTAGNLSGTIPSGVLGNSTLYVGTTAVALNRASASLALTGITSIDGSAASVANALTFNNGGAGAVSGSTFNGSGAVTISYNSIGASPLAGSSSLTTTGTVTSGTWSGSFGAVSGANLTGLTAGNLSGTIPSAVLGNSTVYVGTTAVALNRASASLALTGITSIDGTASNITAYTINQNVGTSNSPTFAGITVNGGVTEQSSTVTISGGAVTFDLSTATVFPVTVNAAITTMNITNPSISGDVSAFTVVFNYNGTSYSVAWNANIRWPGGTAPTLTNTNNKRDVFTFFTYDGGTSYNGFISGQNL
jgi:hypothetical protein